MPSKRKTKTKPASSRSQALIAFYPILVLTFILWVLYRTLFEFPVWFDEIFGKALFFGFPVWLYITISGTDKIQDTFAPYKMQTGLMVGLAVGGIFGFTTSLLSLLERGRVVEQAWLFSSQIFWQEFSLAIFTAFWETVLFYSFVMTVIQQKYPKLTVFKQALLTAIIFVIFHIPQLFLQFNPVVALGQIVLLLLFALGQAYLFEARHNGYALVLSHAIWGMVLLTHSW